MNALTCDRSELEKAYYIAQSRCEIMAVRVAEYENAWRTIMAEPCDAREVHCTCVPPLRARVEELAKEKTALAIESLGFASECDRLRLQQDALAEALRKCASIMVQARAALAQKGE